MVETVNQGEQNVLCSAICRGVVRTMTEVVENGKSIGLVCTHCRTLFLNEPETCILCEKVKKIVKIGSDQRCIECFNLFVKRHQAQFPNQPISYNYMGYLYACPFCLDAKQWINTGFVSRCIECKAEGTNRMQLCKSCHQLNFIYPNRGELCMDCLTSG